MNAKWAIRKRRRHWYGNRETGSALAMKYSVLLINSRFLWLPTIYFAYQTDIITKAVYLLEE